MNTVLLLYGSVILVSFITGIFVTIYNNKHKQKHIQVQKTPINNIDKTMINEPPIIEPNPEEIDENKTYYDLPVIVSVMNAEE